MNDEDGLPAHALETRFAGFDVMAQARWWDDATRAVVVSRRVEPPPMRFFSLAEEACARALVARLLDLPDTPGDRELPDVLRMIDGRLAEGETDGWHYDDLPPDGETWKTSLAALDDDARQRGRPGLAQAPMDEQVDLIAAVQTAGGEWHGMVASRIWGLWTRYAATAFYSHPTAWNEIGFSGPAYPRGYKNLGLDRLEPFEVHDRRPADDPLGPRS